MADADEKIAIEVTDGVSPGIQRKFTAMAREARSAHSAIETLKSALASINDANPVTRLQNELNRLSSTLNQSANAVDKLQRAQDAAALAAQKLATEQQRTARETANAEAAQSRAATAALRLQQAQERAAKASDRMARDAEELRRSLYPLYAAQQAHNEAVQRALSLYKAGAIDVKTYTDAVNRSSERLEDFKRSQDAVNNSLTRGGAAARLSRQHMVNLGFQLQDIGVSLASGQNPLVVMAQQGSQIAGIASQAGVGMGTMVRQAAAMLARFVPLTAALGAAYGAFSLFNGEVEKRANLEAYAKSLGATRDQIERLNLDTVTFGDTMRGLWRTIDDMTGAGDFFSDVWEGAKKAFTNILSYIAQFGQAYAATFQALRDVLAEVWNRLPVSIRRPIIEALNDLTGYFETFINYVLTGINRIIEGLNKISPKQIDPFDMVEFGRFSTDFAEASGRDLSEIFTTSFRDNFEQNGRALDAFIERWMQNTETAAKERVRKALADDNADDASKAAARRALALAKVNAELDNELNRLYMLKPEREVQAEFDRIEEQLLGRKITLTAQEAQQIREKIRTLQEARVVQQQYDAIYEESIAAQRDFNATMEAAKKLLADGAISQTDYQRAITRASEAYENAKNPLREYNKELDEQIKLAGMLPQQREIEQQLMQVQAQLLERGIKLSEEENAKLREKLGLIGELNRVADQRNSIWQSTVGQRQDFSDGVTAVGQLRADQNSGFTGGDQAVATTDLIASMGLDPSGLKVHSEATVNVFREMYDRIAELRQADLISEQDAAALRVQVWAKQQQQQLQYADTFFGQLAALQKSENRKMAAIGKAAAIAQAIINTYQSATAAYAAMAGIPYVGPFLGAAAAAAAVAAGMANVAAIRSQSTTGFFHGGYTGDIARQEVAGVVHGREYVMDADATARIGVANLEALRRGAAQVASNGANSGKATPAPSVGPSATNSSGQPVVNNTRIVNVLDPAIVGDYLNTPEGEEVIVNVMHRNADSIRQAVAQ